MATNNITEVKGVDNQNFDYLLAESNYKIDKSLTLRQKSVNVPLVPVLAAPITLDANAFNLGIQSTTTFKNITPAGIQLRAAVNDTQKTIPGINIPIDLSAMDNNILDLRDGELSIQAQYYYEIEGKNNIAAATTTTALKNTIAVNLPSFGNQALLSLFQRAELYIDNQLIAANEFPGMSSNAEYALRYPHCKKLEKNYEIHGMVSTDPKKYRLAKPVQIFVENRADGSETTYSVYSSDNDNGSNSYAYPKGSRANNLDHIFDECKDKNQSYTISAIPVGIKTEGAGSGPYYSYVNVVGILGTITQRIKLADIFPVIDTLPPIYNHKITIKFNRAPTNVLICNTNQCISKPSASTQTLCRFLGFQQFKWFQDVYKITEQVQAKAKEYYSKTIETIITQDQQILTQIQNEPSKAQTLPFNLNVSAAYKNKLLTICIPRTNNYSNQYCDVSEFYSNAGPTDEDSLMVAGPNNTIPAMHYDILKAPANSYTCGYLRQLRVETAGGLELYNFTMENDGFISGPNSQFVITSPQTMLNYSIQRDGMIKMNNYEDVYRQYVKSRLHFQQSEDEALDYESFLKEYCIFCIDLSPFDLSVNEQLRINMTLADWGEDFNPFHAGNYKDLQYMSPAIICNLFKDKILKLEPDRKCSLADMITAKQSEEQLTNTFV